jgi:hypothetical protein
MCLFFLELVCHIINARFESTIMFLYLAPYEPTAELPFRHYVET